MSSSEYMGGGSFAPESDPWGDLTAGYRFFLVEEAGDAREALDLRRGIYDDKVGQPVDVPDEIDSRTWLLAALHTESDQIVGTMRITPRDRGAFECEQFFDLPLRLTRGVATEITRFAVLPLHRKKPDALPAVSLGLFRLSMDLVRRIDADWVVIASQPDQIETYRWLGFEQTGIIANYGTLADAPHELLWHDFKKLGSFEWHPLHQFFGEFPRPEVVLRDPLPEPGAWLRRLRRGRGAVAGSGA